MMKLFPTPEIIVRLKKCHVSLHAKQVFEGSTFEPPCEFSGYVQFGPLAMGAFSFTQGGRFNYTTLGRYCSVAGEVTIGSHPHPTGWLSTNPFQYRFNHKGWCELSNDFAGLQVRGNKTVPYTPDLRVKIGHDVWIGQGAVIKHNIAIGNGAIIGAGAVVTKNVPPYAIAAGVPARVIRMRFPDTLIERMEKVQWWRFAQWDLAGLPFDNPEAALDELENRIALGLKPWTPDTVKLTQRQGDLFIEDIQPLPAEVRRLENPSKRPITDPVE